MEDDTHSDVGIIQGNIHNFKNTLALQLLVRVFEIQEGWYSKLMHKNRSFGGKGV